MITKLFSMYPLAGNQEPKLTMTAYMTALSDIPPLVLSHALHRITRKPGEFLPSVGAIRAEAVLWMKSQGIMPHNPNGDPDAPVVDIQRALTRKAVLEGLPAPLRTEVEAMYQINDRKRLAAGEHE